MNEPLFSYFLSCDRHPVKAGGRLWDDPLPLNRTHRKTGHTVFLSYGDYFSAVSAFLKKEALDIMAFEVSKHLSKNIAQKDIKEISVYLEKHGEFYHPSRIKTVAGGKSVQFVLNVAVSNAGQDYIEKEFRALQKLNEKFSCGHIPKVYAKGEVAMRNGRKIPMFLGEWFDDYHEFHISKIDGTDKAIAVWDTVRGKYFLSQAQAKELYRQIAMILSGCYNPETYEQIYPWHNAAGDFVLKKRRNSSIDVKLITVRQYASHIENSEINRANDLQSAMEAMLVFFLNLSIRIRLDRLDGVGEVVWADDIAVEGAVDGFLEGLKGGPAAIPGAETWSDGFLHALLACNEHDLYAVSSHIADAYNPDSPDVPLIRQNLSNHIHTLHREINRNYTI